MNEHMKIMNRYVYSNLFYTLDFISMYMEQKYKHFWVKEQVALFLRLYPPSTIVYDVYTEILISLYFPSAFSVLCRAMHAILANSDGSGPSPTF